MIRDAQTAVPVTERCHVLGVARSGYYEWLHSPLSSRAAADARLLCWIRRIHAETGAKYGRPRIYRELRAQGIRCGEKRVGRLRRAAGLRAVYPAPYRVTTQGSPTAKAENLLARRFEVTEQPGLNRVWSADLTYLWTGEGWLFLAVILDLASRRIVGWSLRPRMDQELTVSALRMAIAQRRIPTRGPRLHHSDRGVQYTAAPYQRLLAHVGFEPSLSRHANCYDNAVSESFFATLRKELVHRTTFASRCVATREVIAFIEGWYNRKRRHSSLNYLSPVDYEREVHQHFE
jgi:putative transposase